MAVPKIDWFKTPEGARKFLRTRFSRDKWLNSSGDWPGKRILSTFRDLGGRINDQAFWSIRRQRVNDFNLQRGIIEDNPQNPTAKSLILRGEDFDQSKNYLYIVEVSGTDKETREFRTQSRGIASDRRLTLEEIGEEIAERFAERESGEFDLDDLSIDFVQAYYDKDRDITLLP